MFKNRAVSVTFVYKSEPIDLIDPKNGKRVFAGVWKPYFERKYFQGFPNTRNLSNLLFNRAKGAFSVGKKVMT